MSTGLLLFSFWCPTVCAKNINQQLDANVSVLEFVGVSWATCVKHREPLRWSCGLQNQNSGLKDPKTVIDNVSSERPRVALDSIYLCSFIEILCSFLVASSGCWTHFKNCNYETGVVAAFKLELLTRLGRRGCVRCPWCPVFFVKLKMLQTNAFLKDQHSRTVGEISVGLSLLLNKKTPKLFQIPENWDSVLVKVLDAMDVVGSIHSERDAVQAAVAHHAGEAVRVVGLPRSPQDAFHDGLTADGAGLQGVLQTQTHTHTPPQLHNQPDDECGDSDDSFQKALWVLVYN